MSTRRRVGVGAGVLVVLAAAAIAFVYFVVLSDDAPDRLQLGDAPQGGAPATAAAEPAGAPLAGTWSPGPGSVAGYRVREKLAALPARSDAVARTSAVTGSLVLDGADDALTVRAVDLEVDVSTLVSDPPERRDNRMRTEGLQTDTFPTASFTLLEPITLPADAADGGDLEVPARGTLEIHGTPREVTIPLQARLTGTQIEVVGSLQFPMSDFDITTPDIAGFVTVDSDATLEFQVFFVRGA